MSVTVVVAQKAEPDDREVIAAGIRDFNQRKAGPANATLLAVVLRDESGATIGGLWGRTSYGWLFVELLFVPDALRGAGLGAKLMRAAELEAKARGCHAAWLDTYDFQARAFYERLGYAEFGRLDDYPTGHLRHFMRKDLR